MFLLINSDSKIQIRSIFASPIFWEKTLTDDRKLTKVDFVVVSVVVVVVAVVAVVVVLVVVVIVFGSKDFLFIQIIFGLAS